ncbi:MAG: hypothetical protein H7X97_11485 [Opitutaceae bacterium]|nr:hypothetical protein [Verrucomicrobiales bacterium]
MLREFEFWQGGRDRPHDRIPFFARNGQHLASRASGPTSADSPPEASIQLNLNPRVEVATKRRKRLKKKGGQMKVLC